MKGAGAETSVPVPHFCLNIPLDNDQIDDRAQQRLQCLTTRPFSIHHFSVYLYNRSQ